MRWIYIRGLKSQMFDAKRRNRHIEFVNISIFEPNDDLHEELARSVFARRPNVESVSSMPHRRRNIDDNIVESLSFPMGDGTSFDERLGDVVGRPSIAKSVAVARRRWHGRLSSFDEPNATEHIAQCAISAAWRIGDDGNRRHGLRSRNVVVAVR